MAGQLGDFSQPRVGKDLFQSLGDVYEFKVGALMDWGLYSDDCADL